MGSNSSIKSNNTRSGTREILMLGDSPHGNNTRGGMLCSTDMRSVAYGCIEVKTADHTYHITYHTHYFPCWLWFSLLLMMLWLLLVLLLMCNLPSYPR